MVKYFFTKEDGSSAYTINFLSDTNIHSVHVKHVWKLKSKTDICCNRWSTLKYEKKKKDWKTLTFVFQNVAL